MIDIDILPDWELNIDVLNEEVVHYCHGKISYSFWDIEEIPRKKTLRCYVRKCKKDYTSYLPFIKLYLKMNP